MIAFADQWPSEEFKGDFVAFLNSMSKADRQAWRERTDRERNDTMAGRPRKASKPTQAMELIEALDFISIATKGESDVFEYIKLSNKTAYAFNGQIAAGFPIIEDISVCPRLDLFKSALQRCGKSLVITETATGQLSVKGENLRALVPVLKENHLPHIEPDVRTHDADNFLKQALDICGSLANENGLRVVEASLLIEGASCTGTNGAAILQFWHGLDMPPNTVVSKKFADAISKQTKAIVGFGVTFDPEAMKTRSLTIWFENDAWIKTQCYSDSWPDIGTILNVNSFPADLADGLFEGIEAVSHFSEEGTVIFADNMVMSHPTDLKGAQFPVKGLQGGKEFQGKLIKLVAPYVKRIDLTTFTDKAFFFGGDDEHPIRGAIIGREIKIDVNEKAEEINENYTPEEKQQGWSIG